MRAILKSIAAVIVGFIVASAVMMIIEFINGRVLYPELGKAAAGVTDPEKIRFLLATAPFGSFLVVLTGWALGGIAGGWTTRKITQAGGLWPSVVLGALLTLSAVANNLMIPPPVWFWIAGVVVLPVAVFLGVRLAKS